MKWTAFAAVRGVGEPSIYKLVRPGATSELVPIRFRALLVLPNETPDDVARHLEGELLPPVKN